MMITICLLILLQKLFVCNWSTEDLFCVTQHAHKGQQNQMNNVIWQTNQVRFAEHSLAGPMPAC